MEISQLKQLLSITDILQHLGLAVQKPNGTKSYSMHCPFHQEKNKRKKQLSVYFDSNSVYCFSTHCPTHPHSLDVIGVAKQYYKLGDHEAIMKCKQIIHELGRWPQDLYNPFSQNNEPSAINHEPDHPMKTAEKKNEENRKTTDNGQPTTEEVFTSTPINGLTNKRINALARNEYGMLCYIDKQLQIHSLNEADIKGLNSLRVGVCVRKNPHLYARYVIRQGSLDLYHYEGMQKFSKKVAEQFELSPNYVQECFSIYTELIEKDRMHKHQLQEAKKQQQTMPILLPVLNESQQQLLEDILRSKNILERINELIGKTGIVGEENNRLFLFTILSAYKLQQPLSALIQGSSGSGKTSLFSGVLKIFPESDVFNSTRITDGSLYNFGEYELMFKILANEDIDGLSPQALFALRELVSKGFIISSTTVKDEDGNIKSTLIKVNGPVSFVGCTTQASLYEDNMGRVFTIAVDESIEQTKRIIDYQNKRSAGKINKQEQEEALLLLQHLVQRLQPVEVINEYAELINLPDETHQLRRLNALFKIHIEQTTRLHQYAEKPDSNGVYHSTKEHIRLSTDNFFECIVLKCDELNGEIRKFYEWLKQYITGQSKKNNYHKEEYKFTQREVRQAYKKSKSQISKYIQYLQELEYLHTYSKGNNQQVSYSIDYWDDYAAMRERLKKFIQDQIDRLP